MATQAIQITASHVAAHEQLVWTQTATSGVRVTMMPHPFVPNDTPHEQVVRVQDVGVWLLRNRCGLQLPLRAVFDERGYLCSVFPTISTASNLCICVV